MINGYRLITLASHISLPFFVNPAAVEFHLLRPGIQTSISFIYTYGVRPKWR